MTSWLVSASGLLHRDERTLAERARGEGKRKGGGGGRRGRGWKEERTPRSVPMCVKWFCGARHDVLSRAQR